MSILDENIATHYPGARINKNYVKSVRFRFVPEEDKITAWESSLLLRNQM